MLVPSSVKNSVRNSVKKSVKKYQITDGKFLTSKHEVYEIKEVNEKGLVVYTDLVEGYTTKLIFWNEVRS